MTSDRASELLYLLQGSVNVCLSGHLRNPSLFYAVQKLPPKKKVGC